MTEFIYTKGDIFIVRHGESENNVPGETYVANPHLTLRGKRQSEVLGEQLRMQKITFDIIVTSGSNRTVETASIIRDVLGLPIPNEHFIVDRNLRERQLGLSHLPRPRQKEAAEQYMLRRKLLSVHEVWDDIPESITGLDTSLFETERSTAERFMNSLKTLHEKYRGLNVLVVSHSRAMTSALARLELTNHPHSTDFPFQHISNTGYFTVRFNGADASFPMIVNVNTKGV